MNKNSEIMVARAAHLRGLGFDEKTISCDADHIAELRAKAAKARRKVAVIIGSTIHFVEEN